MINRLMIAGFGGQGVMMIGKLIGECAMEQGLNATFFPSYGAEQRGGTANCTVIQSDKMIGAPHLQQAGCALRAEPALHGGFSAETARGRDAAGEQLHRGHLQYGPRRHPDREGGYRQHGLRAGKPQGGQRDHVRRLHGACKYDPAGAREEIAMHAGEEAGADRAGTGRLLRRASR